MFRSVDTISLCVEHNGNIKVWQVGSRHESDHRVPLVRTNQAHAKRDCLRSVASRAAARAEGRTGGRRKSLDAVWRREITESVLSGRKTGAEVVRLYDLSQSKASLIVAAHRAAAVPPAQLDRYLSRRTGRMARWHDDGCFHPSNGRDSWRHRPTSGTPCVTTRSDATIST
jgi:hypothetical protein